MNSASGRSKGRRLLVLVAALLAFATLFAGLGAWQVQRLAWKEDLIARVDKGLRAPPVGVGNLPRGLDPDQAKGMEYRRLAARGTWIAQATTLVAGPSSMGTGYWALTPLRLDDGRVVYINRGFVPMGTKQASVVSITPAGPVDVVGLLRVSEPKGSFLRPNRPDADLWYARDIAAIAQKHGMAAETGWFIDAQTIAMMADASTLAKQPVAGLTVVNFPNNHLGYAITWFVLALLSLGAIVLVRRYRA